MRSYELPDLDFEALTPEKAEQEIHRLQAEVQADPEHPWLNKSHYQHGDYVKYFQKMTEVAVEADVAAKEVEDAEIIERMESGKSLAQEALIEEAEAEMERLVELGFDEAEIPDDIPAFQVATWKCQRLNAEGNFAELTPLLERELTTLRASGMGTFRAFINDPGFTAEERSEHIELILKRVYAANKEKARLAKP
jgi:hypothetical protein